MKNILFAVFCVLVVISSADYSYAGWREVAPFGNEDESFSAIYWMQKQVDERFFTECTIRMLREGGAKISVYQDLGGDVRAVQEIHIITDEKYNVFLEDERYLYNIRLTEVDRNVFVPSLFLIHFFMETRTLPLEVKKLFFKVYEEK